MLLAFHTSQTYTGWAQGCVTQHYRNQSIWLAIYDPKWHGAIAIATFCTEIAIGDIIPVRFTCLKCGKEVRKGAKVPYHTTCLSSAPHRQ